MHTLRTLAILLCTGLSASSQPLDLTKSADLLTAYVKVRGSLDPREETVVYDEGIIYAVIPNQPIRAIFKLQMYNIARFEPNDSGYSLITREMLAYEDLQTGEILKEWKNPFTNETVEVIHVWNDPVNSTNKSSNFSIPWTRLGDGRVCMHIDVPLFYPSPLKKADWPKESRSDMYQAAELFQFFVSEKDINNRKLKSVPFDISWVRFSDFLPWMRMGERPGYLMYSSRGWKVRGGFEALPAKIKDFVNANHPEYRHAPEKYSSPNMTSWKYYRKIMEERRAKQ
jgi:hypothetical protein